MIKLEDFYNLIPGGFYAILIEDKKNPVYKDILFANGTKTMVGENAVPFTSYLAAEEAAEHIKMRQYTKIISWDFNNKDGDLTPF
jgi:hypothetical protein